MKWTVSRRITVGYAVCLALVVVVGGIAIFALRRSDDAYGAAFRSQRSVFTSALEARVSVQDANLLYLYFVLQPDEQLAQRHDVSVARARVLFTAVRDSALTTNVRQQWSEAATLLERWNESIVPSMAAARAGRQAEALRIRDERVIPARQALNQAIIAGTGAASDRADEMREEALAAAERMKWILLGGSLTALLIGIVAGVLLNRAVSEPLRKTTTVLASSAAQILAATTEQAASAAQTSAAISETVTTVDEVTQTADQAAQRARAVSDLAQRAAQIGASGRGAVDETVTGMHTLKEQIGAISEHMVALSEQAQAIGEIIATVTEIAEQTNLLALNAAVEAARAGEHGRGFAVVAAEVRSLADDSRKATVQVRQILGQIQRATASAVASTEQGARDADARLKQITQAGETIRTLGDAIAEASQAAAQIVASSSQQAAGMTQIRDAMASLQGATQQNLAATRQAENAAQDLNALGTELLRVVGADGNRHSQRRAGL